MIRATDSEPRPGNAPSDANGSGGDDRHGASTSDLQGMWHAGRAAVGHVADLARIRGWRARARVRGLILGICGGLLAGLAAAAATVTVAVWATAAFLQGVSELAGGGLPGVALALAALLAAVLVTWLVGSRLAARSRIARWRAQLDRSPEQSEERSDDAPSPEEAALSELERRTRDELRRDGQRIARHGARLCRDHPFASMSAGAASGFAAARVVLSAPRPWRRTLVSALRVAQSAGWALGLDAVSGALRGDRSNRGSPES